MSHTTPTVEPTVLQSGMSWEWDRYLSDYTPADGWTLKYAFTGPSAVATITASASSDNTTHEVRVLPAATVDLTPGTYKVQGWVDDGTNKWEVFRSTVSILADLDSDTDARSADEVELAAVEAAIAALDGGSPVAEVRVNGRTVTYATDQMPSLYARRGTLRALVWRARNPGKIGVPVTVTFP